MTREEAISYAENKAVQIKERIISDQIDNIPYGKYAMYSTELEFLSMTINALREQEERENPKPLTLDELQGMDGEPVWLLPDRKCFIVNNNFLLPYGERHPCGVDMWGAGTGLSLLAKCGVYRYLPKEDDE